MVTFCVLGSWLQAISIKTINRLIVIRNILYSIELNVLNRLVDAESYRQRDREIERVRRVKYLT
ncbi:hypothetical protein GCM10007978_27210 [Shewanella hanedai]|nr:hypothetical protein GCM10007978_27210 [Shewanella hanedai]